MVFHWSLSGSKSHQDFRTFLSILDYLNNAVVWMVLILPLTSIFSSLFSRTLETVPKTPTTFGTIVIFLFHRIFNFLPTSKYFFIFTYWSFKNACVTVLSWSLMQNLLSCFIFMTHLTKATCNNSSLFSWTWILKDKHELNLFTRVRDQYWSGVFQPGLPNWKIF